MNHNNFFGQVVVVHWPIFWEKPRFGVALVWRNLGLPDVFGSTVAHKYNTPLICTLLLCQVVFLLCWALFDSSKHFLAMPSGFSAIMPSIFLPFWVVFAGFFALCQAVFSYAKHFSALPTIFLLCWAHLGSVKNFPAMLSPFPLYQAFFFYTELLCRSAKHFSSMLNIFLPYQAFFFYAGCFFCCAKHFSAMLVPCLLCQAFFFHAVQYTAEQKNTRQSRKPT